MQRVLAGLRVLGLAGLVPTLVLAAGLALYGTFFRTDPNDIGLSQFLAMLAACFGFLWYAACVTLAWIIKGFARQP